MTFNQQMADNIEEVFWLLDASTKKVVAVNRAYEKLTGRSLESIERNPSSYEDLIHPADRVRVLARLEDAVHTGRFDEDFASFALTGLCAGFGSRATPFRLLTM